MKLKIEEIRDKLDQKNYEKLAKINNPDFHEFLVKYVKLLNPDSIFVSDDSPQDIQYIRDKALRDGEEKKLAIEGHTVHFDGTNDQARDKKRTKFMVDSNSKLTSEFNTVDKQEGQEEVFGFFKDIMVGRELLVSFYSLGPSNSLFTIPAVQLTDSSYVAHSESILYRPGYKEFLNMDKGSGFFKFVHSEGKLENAVSVDVDKRRVYIDTRDEIVYSVNTQYGGNTIGLKKLAMRLAIRRASEEGWLTEHMFISGIHGPKERVTYFMGAFPSMCGKTSTAMIPTETIVGDDIAYIRKVDGTIKAVNVEEGLFGIIKDINPEDDPIIWDVLHSANETIFSNILVTEDGDTYWIGKPTEMPEKGINYSGKWWPGKKDEQGNEITPSHKNARFTTNLRSLENLDPNYNNPDGVSIGGIVYGGRDSDTNVPVLEAYNWKHGIVTIGASLESETTAATLGKTGVRTFNPMSNMDFLSIPIGKYLDMNINFGDGLDNPPKIFGVNYFLKGKDGEYISSILDKRVWLKWMELRVHGEVDAIDIGTGYIPYYEDLRGLFEKVLDSEYSKKDYEKQFSLRVVENLSKIDRITKIYEDIEGEIPSIMFEMLKKQRAKLIEMQKKYGDYIKPDQLA
ncbi:MAG: phosphoenolpyruvate carboxykinase (GTP) [Actinomycetia bacterium]|nr:phosphoenolpyruvate carboxykinase (GTP) [Actinomycetes bacterium]